MIRQRLVPLVASLALMTSLPALAQAPISQGRTSGELAVTADQLRVANAEMGARITDLSAENAQLRGEIETLQFLLSQTREDINDMQRDDSEIARLIGRLESRIDDQDAEIASLKSGADDLREASSLADGALNAARERPGSIGSAVTEAPEANVFEQAAPQTSGPRPLTPQSTQVVQAAGAPQQGLPQGTLGTISATELPDGAGELFADAKSKLLRFDFAGAEIAFRTFVDRFGDDPQVGEAQYWLAESLHQQEAYAASGQAYTKMIREYPDDARAPEALAKLARSMRLIGDTEKACNALNLLNQRYPDASGVTKNLARSEGTRAGCAS